MNRFTKFLFAFILLLVFLPKFLIAQYINNEPFAHTYSIVAYDPSNGDMGIAVQSHWFSVGTSVSWGEAGVGIVATQAVVNFDFGPQGLALLKKGLAPDVILDSLLKTDPGRELRQVAILDNKGNVAVNTGKFCVMAAGHQTGQFYSVQANLVDNDSIWIKMAMAFEKSSGTLGERMLTALEAGQAMGGDIRGKQSASLLVVRGDATGKPWLDRKVDLRVDDSKDPLGELKRLYQVRLAYDALNLGNHALGRGNLEQADIFYKKAQSLNPENGEMLFWYAVELANMGQKDRALSTFKLVFDSDSDNNWRTKILPRIYTAGILSVNEDTWNEIKNLK